MNHNLKIYYCEKSTEKISQHSLAYFLLEDMLRRNYSCQEYPGLHLERPEYGRTKLGKPYLKDYPQIHFNISHCPVCVACIIGPEPVGVDVERRFPWKDSLAKRVCHPRELELLGRMEDSLERQAWLNRIWSRKESYLKYKGTGLRQDLRKLCVTGPEAVSREECQFLELQTDRFTLTACGRSRSIMEVEKIDFL